MRSHSYLQLVNIHQVLALRPDDGLKNKPKHVTCKVVYVGIPKKKNIYLYIYVTEIV